MHRRPAHTGFPITLTGPADQPAGLFMKYPPPSIYEKNFIRLCFFVFIC